MNLKILTKRLDTLTSNLFDGGECAICLAIARLQYGTKVFGPCITYPKVLRNSNSRRRDFATLQAHVQLSRYLDFTAL